MSIGIERLMGIYFPFVVPSDATCKKFVVGAWITGGVIALIPMPAFIRVRFDQNCELSSYCFHCIYNGILYPAIYHP